MSNSSITSFQDPSFSDRKVVRRKRLTRDAEVYRAGLFKNGRLPSTAEKDDAFKVIKGMADNAWYDRHTHSNWCTHYERKVAARARRLNMRLEIVSAKLQENPNPSLNEMKQWATEIANVSLDDIIRMAVNIQVSTTTQG